MNTKKISLCALLISLSLVLSYVERLIPFFVSVPGVKIGLANIAVLFTLYKVGTKEAYIVSFTRVLLSGLLFGTVVSFVYSLTGAIISLTVMVLLKKLNVFSAVSVSIVGGIIHNLSQLFVAGLVLKTEILKYYSPVLFVSGIIAGAVIGLVSATLIKRVDIE